MTIPKHDVHLFGGGYDGETIRADVRAGYIRLARQYRHDIAAYEINQLENNTIATTMGVEVYHIEEFRFGGDPLFFGLPPGVTPMDMMRRLWSYYVEGELE